MEQRRTNPWLWVIGILVLLLIVGVVAYYLGTLNAQPVAFRPRMFVVRHPFLGGIGFWLIVLLIALGIGAVVAALWPSARRTETSEEWHQREHAVRPPTTPTAAPSADAAPTTPKPDGGAASPG